MSHVTIAPICRSTRTPRAVVGAILVLALLALIPACSKKGLPDDAKDWDPTAAQQLRDLAAKADTSEVKCAQYTPDSFDGIKTSYKAANVPLPLATGICENTAVKEQTTFESFPDPESIDRFVVAKRELICRRGAGVGPDFDGLPYIRGEDWIAEPDSTKTAEVLAKVLGGTVQNMCPFETRPALTGTTLPGPFKPGG